MPRKNKVLHELSAGGVVFRRNKEIKILLLKNQKGLWVLPKGKIDKDENLEETALREIREETGLSDLKIIKSLGKEHYFYRAYTKEKNLISKTVYYFLVENKKGNPVPQKEEGFVKAYWFDYNLALEKIAYKASQNILKKAIEKLII